MIQLQFLNKILNTHDLSLVTLNNIGVEYFSEYEEEFKFIQNHYDKYAKVPDKETFIAKFTDFNFIDVQESDTYLVDALQEDYVYRRALDVFKSVNEEMVNGDSRRGVELLLSKIPDLTAKLNVEALDILKEGAKRRFDEYCDKGNNTENYYISTGIKELDEIIGGWNKSGDLVAVCGRPGTGKCLEKGTEVLMADGTIKKIEDIVVGDKVQSYNRVNTVIQIHNGIDKGYRIIPSSGESFVVSAGHILTLCERFNRLGNSTEQKLIDMTVEEYLQTTETRRGRLTLYRPPVEYTEKALKIPPYILGIWLGDGTSERPEICTSDVEVYESWKTFAESLGYVASLRGKEHDKANSYEITSGIKGSCMPNKAKELFKYYDLFNNKHIPLEYMTSSREQRMQLLAGIIDADGYVDGFGYELCQKSYELIKQVSQLARGLGFRVGKISENRVTLKSGILQSYYTIHINGAMETLPVRVPRRKIRKKKTKRVLSLYHFKVEPVESIEYYGFACDGDNRFMLADNTLTHNSWWMDLFLANAAKSGKTVALYSGEMSESQVGYRIDTFMSGISNWKISHGYSDVFDDYQKHIEGLQNIQGKFYVCTPKTLGGIATVPKLRAFCERYKVDLLGVDQYSLMDDANKNRARTERYEAISKDLKTLQIELGIPVLVNAQLNRGAVSPDTTEIGTEHIAGSDRIAQDSSIVLAITRPTKSRVCIHLTKVREATTGGKLTYEWQVDKGEFTFVPDDRASNTQEEEQYTERNNTREETEPQRREARPQRARRQRAEEQTNGNDEAF